MTPSSPWHAPGLELVALTPSAVGLTGRQTAVGKGRGAFDPLENVNPFALPEDDAADVVLIESHSYRLAAARHPERIGDAMRTWSVARVSWLGWTPISSRSASLPPRSSGSAS
jgi:hypothetical protein